MAEFDEYRGYYEQKIERAIAFSGKAHDFFIKVKADYLLGLARTFDRQTNLEVLDVGCGNGSLHGFLLASDQQLKITGVDVATEFLDDARRRYPAVRYETYDGIRLPYGDAEFDLAFAICVMHHVPPAQWENFLREMSRVVRPAGKVAILEHNPWNPLTSYIVKTCPLDQNAILLPAQKTARLMTEAGLDHVAVDYILFTPFANRMARRVESFLSWLPLGAQYACVGQKARR